MSPSAQESQSDPMDLVDGSQDLKASTYRSIVRLRSSSSTRRTSTSGSGVRSSASIIRTRSPGEATWADAVAQPFAVGAEAEVFVAAGAGGFGDDLDLAGV